MSDTRRPGAADAATSMAGRAVPLVDRADAEPVHERVGSFPLSCACLHLVASSASSRHDAPGWPIQAMPTRHPSIAECGVSQSRREPARQLGHGGCRPAGAWPWRWTRHGGRRSVPRQTRRCRRAGHAGMRRGGLAPTATASAERQVLHASPARAGRHPPCPPAAAPGCQPASSSVRLSWSPW